MAPMASDDKTFETAAATLQELNCKAPPLVGPIYVQYI
jgi:hypothetical protein